MDQAFIFLVTGIGILHFSALPVNGLQCNCSEVFDGCDENTLTETCTGEENRCLWEAFNSNTKGVARYCFSGDEDLSEGCAVLEKEGRRGRRASARGKIEVCLCKTDFCNKEKPPAKPCVGLACNNTSPITFAIPKILLYLQVVPLLCMKHLLLI